MATPSEFDLKVTATYRLQFHKDFSFWDGARLAGYLRDLGVSHVYSSPIATARAGSNHGYDVVDFARVNPELGGEAGLEALVTALRCAGLGLIVDIVPNHMCVGGADNPSWLDLLENGRASRYADFFDVDFDAPTLSGKILAPFLGAAYCDVLAAGDLRLQPRKDNGRYAIHYNEHCFPLCQDSEAEVRNKGVHAFAAPDRLHALLQAQPYRLASWRTANDLINYRRFFDIASLAAIRIERPAAFEIVHELPLKLYERGWIDGLRVDHVDGLTDPKGYCETLVEALRSRRSARPRELQATPYVVVEKILAPHEQTPAWPVAGTTGYDFMNQVSALQHAQEGAKKLGDYWRTVSGRTDDFEEEERSARRELLETSFNGQFEATVDAVFRCRPEFSDNRDLTRNGVRRAIKATVSHLRVYRSYALGGPANPGAGRDLEAAFAAALREASPDEEAVALLRAVMNSRSEQVAIAEAIRRFNQLTAPLAAKAVEDTALYRYGRLLSRNDVGFDAARLGMDSAEFHRSMADRAARLPHSMLATATHDHKRGEDVRARLAVLSEIPERWIDRCRGWSSLNAKLRGEGFDPADEQMLYQMIFGAWPLELEPDSDEGLRDFAERLVHWQRKALREAKLRSSWIAPNLSYERVAEQFTRAVLDRDTNHTFVDSVADFVAKAAPAGLVNSLAQTALRCLAPGVPDLYRGCELWDFTLVDPDNRMPVDYESRVALLAQDADPTQTTDFASGAIKQRLIRRLLLLRRQAPELFAFGDYREIAVEAPPGADVVAFARRYEQTTLVGAVLVHVGAQLFGSTRLTPPPDIWGDARLQVEDLPYRLVWGDAELTLGQSLACVFAHSPVAVWISDGRAEEAAQIAIARGPP